MAAIPPHGLYQAHVDAGRARRTATELAVMQQQANLQLQKMAMEQALRGQTIQNSLAQYQAMQNALGGFQQAITTNAMTAQAAHTTASYFYEPNTFVAGNHTCHTACGCREEARQAEVTHKTWADTKPGKVNPPLSLKTTPLFGFLRWRYDSPFAPLHRWFIRRVFGLRRTLA
jgi:hypothetical protein